MSQSSNESDESFTLLAIFGDKGPLDGDASFNLKWKVKNYVNIPSST